jgi:hypothetical protein
VASYSLKRFTAPTTLGTSAASLYTVQAPNTNAVTKQLLIANYSASSANVTIYAVPSGGTAGNGNAIIPAIAISANSTITLDLTQVLNVGDALWGLCSSATAINVMISGYEVQ